MREKILRQFFDGTSSAIDLARDVAGSTKKATDKVTITSIEDMDGDFSVTADMAIRLCDAVLAGDLPVNALKTIGFALMASDKFQWDADEDDVLASVIGDWSCPEVNYPLTIETVQRFRAWLTRTEEYPARPEAASTDTQGKIISVDEKKTVRSLRKRLRDLT